MHFLLNHMCIIEIVSTSYRVPLLDETETKTRDLLNSSIFVYAGVG